MPEDELKGMLCKAIDASQKRRKEAAVELTKRGVFFETPPQYKIKQEEITQEALQIKEDWKNKSMKPSIIFGQS